MRRDRSEADLNGILAGGRPPVLLFWYRSSPVLMIPEGNTVTQGDPPSLYAGMVSMTLDTEGRLVGFQRMPPQLSDGGHRRSRVYNALDQMQGRGLTPSVIEDTLARGTRTPGRQGAGVYTTGQARVVVNPDGSVKTVMPQ